MKFSKTFSLNFTVTLSFLTHLSFHLSKMWWLFWSVIFHNLKVSRNKLLQKSRLYLKPYQLQNDWLCVNIYLLLKNSRNKFCVHNKLNFHHQNLYYFSFLNCNFYFLICGENFMCACFFLFSKNLFTQKEKLNLKHIQQYWTGYE